MLLIASRGRAASGPASSTLLARALALTLATRPNPSARAVARRDAVLLRVFRRRFLDHRPHHVLHRRDPVGDELPPLAGPLLDAHRVVALVIGAGDLERRGEIGPAELCEPLLGDVEVLETIAHLPPGQRLAPLH